MSNVRFSHSNAIFFNTLRKRIDEYFKTNNIKQTGNWKLYSKTIILISSMLAIYFVLLLATPTLPIISLILCALLGFLLAAIGFNVMHDGSHGSYSKINWLNNLMGYTLNFMGGNMYIWKQKHNVNHHSFTNIEGLDDDIDIKPFIRTHKDQKYYKFHKFQHIYGMLLYCATYLFWIFFQDYKKYFKGKIAENTKMDMPLKEHFIFWISKIAHFIIWIIIPIYVLGWLPVLIGYGVIVAVCGFFIATVFQLAHIVEDASFVAPPSDEVLKIETEWAVHQLKTTANFATKNKTVSWLLGGLNFQVEHHLFPRISHIHYPKINEILKDTCKEFNVMYIEFPNVISAIKSHLLHLKHIGASA